jgi:LysM repeat protein
MYPVKTNNLRVTSYYGNREYYYQGKLVRDFHNGIDLVGGSEIVAFADGTVTGVQKTGEQYGTGCYVRIKHDNGWYTLYYHLKSGSVVVNVGQRVSKGQKLGIMGATGRATGVHLHFQIDKGSSSTSINPYDYIFNGKELVPSNNSGNKKSNEELAKEVIRGDWGNGSDRRNRLTNAGYDYSAVQSLVNQILSGKTPQSVKKTNEQLANEVIRGDWGNGQDRKNRLTSAGYDYSAIQSLVNQKLGVGSKPANNSQRTYIVQKGDTLWGIAKRYYGNGNRYPEIARANNIANPNIIHIGQKLIIP